MTSNQPSSSSSSPPSSTQNKKTIEFWNDLYQKDPTHHKEWILHPSTDLFHRLVEALPLHVAKPDSHHGSTRSHVSILEIGCGTSTLSRDFWRYCRQEHTHLSVSVMATDVSQVCIEQNKARDQEELHDVVLQEEQAKLEYRELNIAEPLLLLDTNDEEDATDSTSNAIHTSRIQPKSFDMILDKGCLDTFAFRSRQRGDQKDSLVQSVLNNVCHLLKDGADNDDNQSTSTGGVYVIVSPRAKFRRVQNYPGFAKVQKIALGAGETKADLMESNAYSNSHNNSNITTGSQSRPPTAKKERDTLYMYVCSKKLHGYKPQEKQQQSTGNIMVPDDADICPACGIAFRDFRKGEDVKGRGAKYWTRMFRGHVRHCKG